ncbi:receptor for retinol uptake stra6-like isoform X2 [Babylonia areolata]
MNSLSRSSRISYACAFGATAFLVYQIVLEKKYAINYTGNHRAVKSFVAIGSMFIYGLVFFPVFASLAIDSVFGYILGALYVWMLTAVQFFKALECENASVKDKLLLILRGLPGLLCLVYLSVSIPLRGVRAWRQGHYFEWKEDNRQDTNTLSDIRASYAGHHVTKLFRKPKAKPPAPSTIKGRIIHIVRSTFHRLVYHRKKGFHYSARIFSVLFVAIIVVYTLTIEILVSFVSLFDVLGNILERTIDATVGPEPVPGEDQEVALQRGLLQFYVWLVETFKICIIVADVLAVLFAVLNVLHTLSNYRLNLFALYRGDHSRIPPSTEFSNSSHCISSIKYAGFQVGYIIWSYVIQFLVLLLLCLLCAGFVTIIIYDFAFIIIWVLQLLWPLVLTVVLVAVTQFLLAKFLFLQERGLYLALDNRSAFFSFTYFMFFYNVFLGLASCILRILKAMLLGIAFLSRLDYSTLSRRFERMDPGFRAYVGYMHMEAAHTHPVMIVFCRLMFLGLSDKREREKSVSMSALSASADTTDLVVVKNNKVHTSCYGSATDPSEIERRRRAAVRFNWHVIYTLLHNPDIRVMRKGYLQMFHQARLMGVYIPVSDRQADVDFDQLQERMADARQKLNPTKEKKKKDEGVKDAKKTLKEVVMGQEKGVNSADLPIVQVNDLPTVVPLTDSSSPTSTVPGEESVEAQSKITPDNTNL